LDLEKYPRVSPKIMLVFEGWENFHWQYIYMLKCSPHQYWGLKKVYIFTKKFIYFQVFNFFFSNCSKMKGPIQVLANAFEKCSYINLALKTNANNSFKKCTQIFWYYFINSFIWCTFYLETPNLYLTKLHFGLLYHVFMHGMQLKWNKLQFTNFY